LAHQLPKEKKDKQKDKQYDLLFDLLNLVQEPVQWEDLPSSVSPKNLISWCEKYGVVLPMEVMPDGGEGVPLTTAQVEVLTLYLIYNLWQSVSLPLDNTQDILEQEEKERVRLIQLLHQRYFRRNLLSPAHTLRVAVSEDNPARQRILVRASLQEIVSWQFNGLTPFLSLVHHPPQLVMQAQCPMTVAYWQLANLLLKPDDGRHYHICPCGRSFHGRPNRVFCSRCDRRTAHSRKRRGTAAVNAGSMDKRENRRGERHADQSQDAQ
jgi:hypothetical protein